jgi:GTPase SAR1 family protein
MGHDISESGRFVEETKLGSSQYGRSTRALIDVINDLPDCGTEQILPLPKIAVVGNQSAGKSSLIEAISHIRVPRSKGTCTRCPMEVVLRRGKSWSCRVSLRFDYDVPNESKGTFPFRETSSKDEVAEILRRAQMAILNPSTSMETFLEIDLSDCSTESKFSRNTVVAEIIGADVDVTFIDLPGIISNVEKVFPSYRKLTLGRG